MPHFRSLPQASLQSIADQLGNLFNVPERLGAAGTSVTLNEAIELWSLPADATLEPTNDFRLLAQRTGQWHHQIKLGGNAAATALSMPSGPAAEDWKVTQFSQGDLAAKIDEVVGWLSANAPANAEVRLLMIPAYQVVAAWLLDNNDQSVVIISATRPISDTLGPHHFFTTKEVLDVLRSVSVAEGII